MYSCQSDLHTQVQIHESVLRILPNGRVCAGCRNCRTGTCGKRSLPAFHRSWAGSYHWMNSRGQKNCGSHLLGFFLLVVVGFFYKKVKRKNISWRVLLSFTKRIQNSATQTSIIREMATRLHCVFYFHATTLLLYLYKKKTKTPKNQQRLYSRNTIQPQLRKYQVLLLITQTFSKARFVSRGLIKIPDWKK